MIQYLDIGIIVNTHGIKGEVKVMPLTDNPERYEKLKSVYVEGPAGLEEYHLSGVKYLKNFVIIKFDEIDNIDVAEAMKNKVIKIDRENAVKLPKGSFFISDLIGCEVIETNGTVLGKLKEILQTGSNDVYVVVDENNREILIPALKSVVNEVSIENRRITVTLPKGLLDDEV